MFSVDTRYSDYMSIVVTHSCNRNCPFCIDKYRGTDIFIDMGSVHKALVFAKNKGIGDILLVGGEPTLHPNIVNIAKLFYENNFRVILTSNFDHLDRIYELNKYVDYFNMSYYGQKNMPNLSKLNHADITLSTLIYQGVLDTKEKLDEFIDKWGKEYKLKFSTLTPCNEFCKSRYKVDYLDDLDCEWVVLFNEILGQVYRGCIIKRYDKVINKKAKQSYKCHVDGSINTSWEEDEEMLDRFRNVGHVKIKEDRECMHCKGIIPKGSKCLTVNGKYKGRKWLCSSCEEILKDLSKAKSHRDSLPFGDEGGYLAMMDEVASLESDWYETKNSNRGKVLKVK